MCNCNRCVVQPIPAQMFQCGKCCTVNVVQQVIPISCCTTTISQLTPNERHLLNKTKMRQESKRLKQIRKEASLSMERHAQDIRIQEAAKQFKNQRKKYERERINAAREMMQNYNPANSQYRQGFSDGRASVCSTSRDTEMSGRKAVAAFLICGLFIGIFVFLGILGFATLLI